ncbi:MAG: nucleotidyl transferase AbiEii/AbiGii toxin family protein [Eubacterium sp.]|nr:nucleotidyl transferase AbiEii/AbiGii toxin family protein [Eubacterium sp.]
MELMEFLYRVMEEMADAGVPIVFKGAMVLNLAIRDNNPSKVERATRDIDGDWTGELPTMEKMEQALRNAVKKVDSSMDVQAGRIFGEKKSAGFKIVNENGEKVAGVDLSVRQNRFCRPYISYVNGVSLNGASLSKMLSDKIYAISGEQVCRRMKDVLDIYVLSFITEVDADVLCRIWEETGRKPGNFEAFKMKFNELNEAYGKMKGVKNKPDFIDVYTRVNRFVSTVALQMEEKVSNEEKSR